MGVRGQLAGLVAATTSVVLLAFLVPIGILLRSEAEKRAISSATLQAQSFAAAIALDPGGAVIPSTEDGSTISVFLPDGRVVGAPARRTGSIELAARGRAFTADAGEGGIEVLVPVQGLPQGTAVVRAHVADPELHRDVNRTWALLAALGLALFGFGLLVADRLGRRLVGSVTALAGAADRLGRGDLSTRVAADQRTRSGGRELARVGAALDRLAERITELLAAEREEVADLAHRLRTPVTALRLDVESVRDPEEQSRLAADVDALGRAVDEVIRTARRPVREGVRAAADLAEVAADRVAFWSVLAEETGRSIRVELPGRPVPVRASREDLVVALDALLENVFAHTPDDAAALVSVLSIEDGGGLLVVEDAGPGFPPEGFPAEGLTRGVSARGSTGLGLDIARRTAVASGGVMTYATSPLGGARVELRFAGA
jgi:signal transduction histidine kinase